MSDIDIFEIYARAGKLFENIKEEPYSKAIQIIDLNLSESEDQTHQFIWEVVRCKLNARQKARELGGIA